MIAKEPAAQALAERRRLETLASAPKDEGSWKPLPGARVEVLAMRRLFEKGVPVKLLLGSEASEQQLNELAQRGELGNYRYIHLATHAAVDNTIPLHSAVILSRDRLPDAKQRTELLLSGKPIPDGRLTVEEVLQRWNLQSDLVTLSAGQPASGKYERGEGFVSLAQGLVLCGTRSVCLSLWKGNETATALLMERFYQNLLGKREGLTTPMPKAAALTEAKSWLRTLPRREVVKRLATLSEGISRGKSQPSPAFDVPAAAENIKADDCPFAHPYYWAAFVLIGHADSGP
jgi:CHAT domain-containing protein